MYTKGESRKMGDPIVSLSTHPGKAARNNQGQAAEDNCNSHPAEIRKDIAGEGYLRQGITRVNEKDIGSQSL